MTSQSSLKGYLDINNIIKVNDRLHSELKSVFLDYVMNGALNVQNDLIQENKLFTNKLESIIYFNGSSAELQRTIQDLPDKLVTILKDNHQLAEGSTH